MWTDVIVDGLDNFQTRYLLNDFAVQTQSVPYMFAGVIAGDGKCDGNLCQRDQTNSLPSMHVP